MRRVMGDACSVSQASRRERRAERIAALDESSRRQAEQEARNYNANESLRRLRGIEDSLMEAVQTPAGHWTTRVVYGPKDREKRLRDARARAERAEAQRAAWRAKPLRVRATAQLGKGLEALGVILFLLGCVGIVAAQDMGEVESIGSWGLFGGGIGIGMLGERLRKG